jgi:hypothetical protein
MSGDATGDGPMVSGPVVNNTVSTSNERRTF